MSDDAAGIAPTTAVRENILKADRLSCIRGGRLVFANLSFEIGRGHILALRGPNGSGKSSLLRILAGLLPPAEGMISWNGKNVGIDAFAHRTRISYVGHLDAVKAALTVRENVEFWAKVSGIKISGAAGNDSIDKALTGLGIAHLRDLPARFLSAGQKRRLNLARLAAISTPVWLLDEPSVSLDRESVALLDILITDHCAKGGIAIIATHNEIEYANAITLNLCASN
jgi:heme exporter protein A